MLRQPFTAPLHLRHGNNLSCQVSAEPLALASLVIIVYLPCQSAGSPSHSSICMGSLHTAAPLAAGSLPILRCHHLLFCAMLQQQVIAATQLELSGVVCFLVFCIDSVKSAHGDKAQLCAGALGSPLGLIDVYFGTTRVSIASLKVKLAIYVLENLRDGKKNVIVE